jgi:hypothetical protein
MLHRTVTGQRLIALFVMGWLAFNYPLLSLFDGTATWFGIPRLFAYLFVAWIVLIGLLAFTAERPVAKNESTLKD